MCNWGVIPRKEMCMVYNYNLLDEEKSESPERIKCSIVFTNAYQYYIL